jgi:hypothetical protein
MGKRQQKRGSKQNKLPANRGGKTRHGKRIFAILIAEVSVAFQPGKNEFKALLRDGSGREGR